MAKKQPERQPQEQEGAAHHPGEGGLEVAGAEVFLIRGAKTKHGPRQRWSKVQLAQGAVLSLYPRPPAHVGLSELTRQVNEWLRINQPDVYRAIGELSRLTVGRALTALREG